MLLTQSQFSGKVVSQESPKRKTHGMTLSRSVSLPTVRPSTTATCSSSSKTPFWLEATHKLEKLEEDVFQQRAQELAKRMCNLRHKEMMTQALNTFVYHLYNQGITKKQLFEKIDKNGDGMLEKSELQAALRALGCKMTPIELDAVIRAFDADKSGSIDFEEFYDLIAAQESLLPTEWLAPDRGTDPLRGFQLGERLKVNRQLSNAFLHEDPHSEKKALFCTLRGPGRKDGTVIVELEENGELLIMKPGQLTRPIAKRSHNFFVKPLH